MYYRKNFVNKNIFSFFAIILLILIAIFFILPTDDNLKKEQSPIVSTAASGNWDSYRASSFAGGSGTSSSPWQIKTAQHRNAKLKSAK